MNKVKNFVRGSVFDDMKLRTHPGAFLATTLLAVFFTPLLGQSADFFPLDQVKSGLKGVGRTVFEGEKIEEFKVEILGVLQNIAPERNLILARLSSRKLERTGVFAGMSGSPVYIQGKLVGAVAYSFPYSKEPIAGITPIQEIVDIFKEKPGARFRLSRKRSPLKMYRVRSLADILQGVGGSTPPSGMAWQPFEGSRTLSPIATPLSLSGLSPQTLQAFGTSLQAMGLVPVRALGSARAEGQSHVPLQAGSTVTVQLIRGDIDASAAGTATYIGGNRIYAFGHPFMGVGYTDMPLNKGSVLTIIPSLASSQKVTATTEFIGSIRQDRATGILGVGGEEPTLIPIQVSLLTSRNERKQFHFEVVTDPLLSPFLTTLVVFNSISSSERTLGGQTLQVRCTISIKGQNDVNFEDGISDLANTTVAAALAAAAPVNFLLNSGFEEVEMEKVAVDITAVEQTRRAALEKVWVDKREVAAGDEVNLTVFLRKANGESLVEKYPVKIPEEVAPGPLKILVGEGLSVSKADEEDEDEDFVPENLPQLIRAINNLKKNNRLYIRLYRSRAGAVVGGEGLPGLPPSMLELYSSGRTGGATRPIRHVVYAEHELPATSFVLEGRQIIEVIVKR